MATCLAVTAIVCVLVTTVAIIVAFATPNWVRFERVVTHQLCDCANCDCGMWLTCVGGPISDGSIDDCRWFFAREFEVEKKLPDWFKAVQVLMSCAVATSLLSLIIGLFSLCCYSKSCSPQRAAAAFIILTFLLVATSVCVFGAKGHMDYNIIVHADDTNMEVSIFGWSFWIATGAAGMSLITSIIYLGVGREKEYY